MDLMLTESWDLMDDGNGSIALTPSNLYSMAQKTANEIKLFISEGWYDRSQGLPQFEDILGVNPNWYHIRTLLLNCAFDVDGVVYADLDIYVNERLLGGVIYLTSNEGTINVQTDF